MATETLRLTAATPQAVTDARHLLTTQLDGWACQRSSDCLLVFSELVTNAVKHAGGATRIVVVHGHRTLRFEVHDDTRAIPSLRPSTGPAGGFGLRIVDQLSESWGWEQTATGKIVWSNLDCCAGDHRPDQVDGPGGQPS